MNIDYLIKLWKFSNLDSIIIKDLPITRRSDHIIVEPLMIISKEEKICFGEELSSYDYLKRVFQNSIFELIDSDTKLIVKVIYRGD